MGASQFEAAVLSICDPWGTPHGGTLRTQATLRSLRDLGYKTVCVFPSDGNACAEPAKDIESFPVLSVPLGSRRWPASAVGLKRTLFPMPTRVGAANESIGRALRSLGQLQVFVIASLAHAQYIGSAEAKLLWVDFMDTWSDVAAREISVRSGIPRLTARLQRRGIVAKEASLAATADFVSAAGWADAERLRRRTGLTVAFMPNPVELQVKGRSGPLPKVAGFLANFAFAPNAEAFNTLISVWAPRLQSFGWEVLVAGLGSNGLRVPSEIGSLGELDTVDRFYESVGVSLAPIRLGGGMKVKIAESLARSVPVVASAFALEGFPPEVRRLASVVDLDDPDFSGLDEVSPPSDMDRQALDIFSQTRFNGAAARGLRAV